MRIDVRQEGGAVVLAVSGRMDATTVDGFEAACRDRIAPENPRIVVDFAKLEYVSSAGLRGILTMEKESRAAKAGSRLSAIRKSGTAGYFFACGCATGGRRSIHSRMRGCRISACQRTPAPSAGWVST